MDHLYCYYYFWIGNCSEGVSTGAVRSGDNRGCPRLGLRAEVWTVCGGSCAIDKPALPWSVRLVEVIREWEVKTCMGGGVDCTVIRRRVSV